MMRPGTVLLLVLGMVGATVACTTDNPRACSETRPCADPSTPFCDTEGVLGETRNTCVAVSCLQGDALTCADDRLYRCNATRDGYAVETCQLGCSDDARCFELAPSNDADAELDVAHGGPIVELIDHDTFDVATGVVTNVGMLRMELKSVVRPAQGLGLPGLRIYPLKSLIVRGDVRLVSSVREDNPALILVVDGDVAIEGSLSLVPAGGIGPPGMPRAAAGNPGMGTDPSMIGAGGGGHATAGGHGGDLFGMVEALGGTGSPALPHPLLEPLHGGGAGGTSFVGAAYVSYGGGAIQISSRTSIVLRSGAMIDANATLPGTDPALASNGGGAGGAILLEAPVVELAGDAVLTANGVGGSSGDNIVASPPTRGARSVASRCGDPAFCSSGGDGGAAAPPGDATDVEMTIPFGGWTGGGGGAAGYVRINTRSGTSTQAPTAVISPPPQRGAVSVR